MQAFFETLFDAVYLTGVIILGIIMVKNNKGQRQTLLFGIMSIMLGIGDSFHLIPRVYALWTTGLKANAAALGTGKLITSVTMTVFYVILYHIWRNRYNVSKGNLLTGAIYGLAIIRIILCLFPQNEWQNFNAPLSWGIYRNIPFAIMGIIIIALFYKKAKKHNDKPFWFMWLAVTLSFALYIPVVIWADAIPAIGILMIPKTLAYVWIVIMGFLDYKNNTLGGIKQR